MTYGELWFLWFKLGETHVLHAGDNVYPTWNREHATKLYYWEAYSSGLNSFGRWLVTNYIVRLHIRVCKSGEYFT